MTYETPISGFLNTVSDRFNEDSEDVQFFVSVIEALTVGGDFRFMWDVEPTSLAKDTDRFSFDVMLPNGEDYGRFYIGIVDEEVTENLFADPYYMDIRTLAEGEDTTDIEFIPEEGGIFDNIGEEGEEVIFSLVDDPVGYWTDPCRPATWLISDSAIENFETATIQDVTLELITQWKERFAGGGDIVPEKVSPIRLVAKDGKLLTE